MLKKIIEIYATVKAEADIKAAQKQAKKEAKKEAEKKVIRLKEQAENNRIKNRSEILDL